MWHTEKCDVNLVCTSCFVSTACTIILFAYERGLIVHLFISLMLYGRAKSGWTIVFQLLFEKTKTKQNKTKTVFVGMENKTKSHRRYTKTMPILLHQSKTELNPKQV